MYSLMQSEIRKVVTKGKAAGVLRLVFHDAGTFELDDNTGNWFGDTNQSHSQDFSLKF